MIKTQPPRMKWRKRKRMRARARSIECKTARTNDQPTNNHKGQRMENKTLTAFWFQSLTGFKSKWFIILFFSFTNESNIHFGWFEVEICCVHPIHLFSWSLQCTREKSMNSQMDVQSSKWFSWFRLRDLFRRCMRARRCECVFHLMWFVPMDIPCEMTLWVSCFCFFFVFNVRISRAWWNIEIRWQTR